MERKIYSKIVICILLFFLLVWNIYKTISHPNEKDTVNIVLILGLVGMYAKNQSDKLTANKNEKAACQTQINTEHIKTPFECIMDNLPCAAYFLDNKGKFVQGNKNFNRLVDEKCSEITDMGIKGLFQNISDEEIEAENETVLKENRTVVKEYSCIIENQTAVWYRVFKTPVTDNDGNIVGIAVILKDISVEKELENQQERFIATLTHDLKTPIIAQTRSLEMILNGNFGELTPEQREIIELTSASSSSIYEMITTILASYKLENNQIDLNYSEIDFTQTVLDCIEKLKNDADEKNIQFIIKPQNRKNFVNADINYLKNTVLYLLENSLSYAYHNSYIEVLINNDNHNLSFEILTRSPYIHDETLKIMFHKYLGQISNYNKIGYCMKLNYCNQVIKAHHGKIIAKSFITDENILGFTMPLSVVPPIRV